MQNIDIISNTEKEALLTAAKTCKGKLGLIAMKTGRSVKNIARIMKIDEDVHNTIEDEFSTFEAVYKDVTDLQLKLAILAGDPWAVAHALTKTKADDTFTSEVNTVIQQVRTLAKGLTDTGVYHEAFDKLAYKILSISPFTTKAHLCEAFSCSSQTLSQWLNSFPSFNDHVDRGLSEGEAKARNLLLKSAINGDSKVNTALLKVLANNVYNIKDEVQTVVVDNRAASAQKITPEMSAIEASKIYTQMLKEED